ncbi:MAG: CDP-glucose 4,6-dehydratase [Blautia sp.]|nr:CDP-glucose 4,6-dehydratase [Blautia sp.]MCM1237684.1 CDP-glucose 4,6-dehydratase [Ruminococcus flavefaciens]
MMKSFFQGKRILITGHTGFKGTWLCQMLSYCGARLYGFALPDSGTEFWRSAETPVESFWGDIRERSAIAEAVKQCRPEIVIHLASHSTVNQGQELTHYIFETNGMGVVNLLEAVRETEGVRAVLVVTSDKCYRNRETNVPYTESCSFGAQDPYSASKAVQELISECYWNSFFRDSNVKIGTARASNVIGGGDFNRTRLFPSLIDSFLRGETAQIRNPYAIRPWQNVLDVLYGYMLYVKCLYDGKLEGGEMPAFNFGPDADGFVAVQEVADMLCEIFPEGRYQVSGNNTVKETNILKLDSGRAQEILGWKPRYCFAETIRMTAEFEQRYAEGQTAKEICRAYIDDYFVSLL